MEPVHVYGVLICIALTAASNAWLLSPILADLRLPPPNCP